MFESDICCMLAVDSGRSPGAPISETSTPAVDLVVRSNNLHVGSDPAKFAMYVITFIVVVAVNIEKDFNLSQNFAQGFNLAT